MLNVDLAHALHQQRRLELEGHATHARLGREVHGSHRSSRAVRVHVGWWLVSTGLRLAVWDRRTSTGPPAGTHPFGDRPLAHHGLVDRTMARGA